MSGVLEFNSAGYTEVWYPHYAHVGIVEGSVRQPRTVAREPHRVVGTEHLL